MLTWHDSCWRKWLFLEFHPSASIGRKTGANTHTVTCHFTCPVSNVCTNWSSPVWSLSKSHYTTFCCASHKVWWLGVLSSSVNVKMTLNSGLLTISNTFLHWTSQCEINCQVTIILEIVSDKPLLHWVNLHHWRLEIEIHSFLPEKLLDIPPRRGQAEKNKHETEYLAGVWYAELLNCKCCGPWAIGTNVSFNHSTYITYQSII